MLTPCTWTTDGHPCQLVATNYLREYGDPNPGYCLWHYDCLHTPRLADDFPEFERWCALWAKQRTCGQFSHHPVAYLWEAVRGRFVEPAARLVVQPCVASTCWVPEVLDDIGMTPELADAENRAKGPYVPGPWARP